MKKTRTYIGMAAMIALTALTACSSDDFENQEIVSQDDTIWLTSSIEYGSATRSTSVLQTTSLDASVKVGIYGRSDSKAITNGDNNQYSVATSGTLTSASKGMKWPSTVGAKVEISAYAPFQSNWGYSSDNKFTVKSDQSANSDYLASDLLWAQTKDVKQTKEAIPLRFSHKLARINVVVKKEKTSTAVLKGAEVYITGTKPQTTLKPSTGAIGSASGTATDIKVATIASEIAEGASTTVYGIIVPQTLAKDANFIKIVQTNGLTMTAKLPAATEIKSGNSYNYTAYVGVGTDIKFELSSISITDWTASANIGSQRMEEVIGVGDYILTDGKCVKAKKWASYSASHSSAKIAGIIFCTTVSSTDKADGYTAYAMGINRQKMAFHKSDTYPSQMVTDNKINDLAPAIADLDGRTRTNKMLTSSYYTSLTASQKEESMINLGWYQTTKGLGITANATPWYLPSFGQLVQIMNNLGGANFSTYTFGDGGFASGSTYTVGDAAALTTLAGKIQAYVTAAGGQSDMFTSGNINYPSSTENGSSSNAHYGKVFSINFTNSAGWNFGKALSRTDDKNYSVIPVAAIKIVEAE